MAAEHLPHTIHSLALSITHSLHMLIVATFPPTPVIKRPMNCAMQDFRSPRALRNAMAGVIEDGAFGYNDASAATVAAVAAKLDSTHGFGGAGVNRHALRGFPLRLAGANVCLRQCRCMCLNSVYLSLKVSPACTHTRNTVPTKPAIHCSHPQTNTRTYSHPQYRAHQASHSLQLPTNKHTYVLTRAPALTHANARTYVQCRALSTRARARWCGCRGLSRRYTMWQG